MKLLILIVCMVFQSSVSFATGGVCPDLFAGKLQKKNTSVFAKLLKSIQFRKSKSINSKAQNVLLHISGESEFIEKFNAIRNALPGSRIRMGYFIIDSDFTSSLLLKTMVNRSDVEFDIIVDSVMAQSEIKMLKRLNQYDHIKIKLFRPATKILDYLQDSPVIADPVAFAKGLSTQNTNMILSSFYPHVLGIFGKSLKGLNEIKDVQSKGAQFIMMAATLQVVFKELQTSSEMGEVLDKRRLMKFVVSLERYTRRFHHKIFMVSDPSQSRARVTNGGRNISDEYNLSYGNAFLKDRKYPFKDFGISYDITTPKNVKEMQWSFDRMFNSSLDVAKDPLSINRLTENEINNVDEKLAENANKALAQLHYLNLKSESIYLLGEQNISYLENQRQKSRNYKHLSQQVHEAIRNYDGEKPIEIISAYFYMERDFIAAITTAVRRGRTVNIYTNSVKTTDLSMVNGGLYTIYHSVMRDFEQAGKNSGGKVVIHEMKLPSGQTKGSLHAKVFIIGETVIVSSLNFDPRNYLLDTNNGTAIDLTGHPEALNKVKQSFGLGTKLWYPLTSEFVDAFLTAVPAEFRSIIEIDWKLDEDNHSIGTQL